MIDWLNLTLEEAAEKIAEIAADRRTYPEKRAEGGSGLLSGLGGFLQQNPMAAHTLMGGALGAGATGIGTALSNSGKPEDERRSVVGSMLSGAAGGAALGGGLSMAGSALGDIRNGMPRHDSIPHGQFTDPATGQQMTVPPEVLRQHPELADRARQLTQPQGIMDRAWGGVQSLWGGAREAAPVSTAVLPVAAGADLAFRNRGETMGFGHVRPSHSLDPANLRAGIGQVDNIDDKIRSTITRAKKTDAPGPISPDPKFTETVRHVPGNAGGQDVSEAVMRNMRQAETPKTWQQRLQKMFGGSISDPGEKVLEVSHMPRAPGKHREQDPNVQQLFTEVPTEGHLPRRTDALERATVHDAQELGHGIREARRGASTPRSLFRVGPWEIPMHRSIPAIAGRAAFYGGMPLLENAVRSGLTSHNREQELRDMMMRYARPVPQQGGPQ